MCYNESVKKIFKTMKGEKMKDVIVLVGKAATGKTVIEKEIGKRGYHRAISYSSRPIRSNERHGQDYFFVDNIQFEELFESGKLYEKVEYVVNGEIWKYGLGPDSFKDGEINVVTVNPLGLKQLAKTEGIKDRMLVFYLQTPEDLRTQRYLDRETSKKKFENWEQRKRQDKIDFDDNEGVINSGLEFVVIDNNENTTIEFLADKILRILKRKNHVDSTFENLKKLSLSDENITELSYDQTHEDAFLFQGNLFNGGHMASFKYKGYTFGIGAYGDVYAEIKDSEGNEVASASDKSNSGGLIELQHILKNGDVDIEMMEAGLFPKRELNLINNNWFEIVLEKDDSDFVIDSMKYPSVCDEELFCEALENTISNAKNIVKELEEEEE
jgi:guanylate kinase